MFIAGRRLSLIFKKSGDAWIRRKIPVAQLAGQRERRYTYILKRFLIFKAGGISRDFVDSSDIVDWKTCDANIRNGENYYKVRK